MADYLPLFKPGLAVTYVVTADVTAGQALELTGPRSVSPADADTTKFVGVAGFSAKAGERVTVFDGGIQRLVASGAVAAGDLVGTGADGTVATAATNKIGLALTAAADGEVVEVKRN